MTEHECIEKILEKGRVRTTHEQDRKILKPAEAALRMTPWRWRIVGLAASLLLLAVVGVGALSGVGDDSEHDRPPPVAADSAQALRAPRGDGWIRLECGDGAPSLVTSPDPGSTSVLVEYGGEGGVGGGTGGNAIIDGVVRKAGADGGWRFNSTSTGGGAVAGGSVYRYKYRGGGGGSHRVPPADGDGDIWELAPDGSERTGNTEGYDSLVENRFESPIDAPQSTFSVDVDTASYANVRRFLNEGRLPPPGAVRLEELINYFSYDYPEPLGSTPFSVTTEVAVCPWNPKNRLVLVGLQGKTIDQVEIPPRNLVFLLDVSGSMQSPDKLALVKSAMKLLVAQLRPVDRVGIVVYAGASGMALAPTAGSDKAAIVEAIDALHAGGSTNGAQGIRLAYDLARKHFDDEAINRVILATDGDFNVGTTNRDELKRLIEKERESGIFLTVLGVGTGNIKDSQMEMLADCGNGNYAYLDSIREAQKVLVREAGGTLVTIAKDVKIQIEWNHRRVGAYRLIGYENRMLAARDFEDDTKDAGEIGAGHSVTALYEITPPGDTEKTGEVRPLKYQGKRSEQPAALANEILTLSLRHKAPTGSKSLLNEFVLRDPGHVAYERASVNLRFASAVAAFGLTLRNSAHKGDSSFGLVHELASTALGDDPDGDRAEFLRLAVRAGEIAGK